MGFRKSDLREGGLHRHGFGVSVCCESVLGLAAVQSLVFERDYSSDKGTGGHG